MNNTEQLSFFGLDRRPFDKGVSDADLWLPPSKMEVVDDIVESTEALQWSMLTGEPGAGKTSVLRAVRARLMGEGYRLTYSHNSTLGRRDFYRQICHTLGLKPRATAAAVFYAITTHVTELARDNVRPVLFIDEAHLLHQDVLDHLHILGNFQWDNAPLLTIILSGLPDLEDRLAMQRNRSLYSRLHRRVRLSTLKPEDTISYVQHRLRLAGGDNKDYFTSDALGLLHEAAGGNLRDIDRLAAIAMRSAARSGQRLIERGAISSAIQQDTRQR